MKLRWAVPAVAALAMLPMGRPLAVESDPLPLPAAGSRAVAVARYNEGVELLLARRYAAAQAKFEAAIDLHEPLPEAHNNLAFALRMQGREHEFRALLHYQRAISLKHDLAEAYLYRGALYVQRGDRVRAREDLQRLRALDSGLAADLQRIIDTDATKGRAGIAGQYP